VTTPHASLELSDEVAQALRDGVPVVALESTIISHGMPYPQNVEMATGVEQIVRNFGAVPATIAVLGGRPRIGLESANLEVLATSTDVAKVSVRDLPVVIASRGHGATTVAATMRLAALAGIRVFVTGGLGGVHRDGHRTLDISADLTELATTDVAVICAGAKSILDIGLTLEALETLQVPVLAYRTNEFPAFFSRTSGHQAPVRVDTPEQIATVMATKWGLGIAGGIVLANPIPAVDEIPADVIDIIIEHAIEDMNTSGVHGKQATPFLLRRITELTDGASLTANIALVNNNARLGAEVATAYASCQQQTSL
jgi:pseudouridine-5'-phosphate glycosidase